MNICKLKRYKINLIKQITYYMYVLLFSLKCENENFVSFHSIRLINKNFCNLNIFTLFLNTTLLVLNLFKHWQRRFTQQGSSGLQFKK